jgi:hypothetical protein
MTMPDHIITLRIKDPTDSFSPRRATLVASAITSLRKTFEPNFRQAERIEVEIVSINSQP